MNFLITEESEQQKKFFNQKRIFEKQSPQIETEKEKKKLLGGKFESFQNRDPEDTSTIKLSFFS